MPCMLERPLKLRPLGGPGSDFAWVLSWACGGSRGFIECLSLYSALTRLGI